MKVILVAAVTANGMIAENVEQSSLDWTSKEDLEFFIKKTKEAGVVIMGTKTFSTLKKPLKDRLMVVLSYHPENQSEMDGVEYMNKSPQEVIDWLESKGHEQVVLAGGASVYGQYLQAGLVDEMFLTVEPYLFGEGIPLAKDFDRIKMELVESKQIGESSVLMHYKLG
jgi:dihydrofolate reductase